MAGMSKVDYLKRYMDDSSDQKKKKIKKKKKVKVIKGGNIRIVDNDITFKNILTNAENNDDEGLYDTQEEKPILFAADGATILTKEYQEQEKTKQNRWKVLENNDNKRRKIHDSDGSDSSPVRSSKKQRHDSSSEDDGDISPLHNKRHDSDDSDLSPKRITKDNDSDSDISPLRQNNRKSQDSDNDLSPKRQSSNKRSRVEEEPEVMSTGRKSGLQSGKDVKEENKRKHAAEMKRLNEMDESVSGKGSTTVYRDRHTGKKIDLKFEELKKRKLEEEKIAEKEKHAEWGKGVAQKSEYQQKLQEDLHEVDKPLARYKNDGDLDSLLKSKDRDGDPMLAYLTKKKEKKSTIQKPRYNGPTPPANRFNIWPGYRYDGVDRSNGFEKKRFTAISQQKSLNTDAYKWSVEDM